MSSIKYQRYIFKCSIKLKIKDECHFLKVKNIFSKLISHADLQFLCYLIFFYHYLLSLSICISIVAVCKWHWFSNFYPIFVPSFRFLSLSSFLTRGYIKYENEFDQFDIHPFSFKVTMCFNLWYKGYKYFINYNLCIYRIEISRIRILQNIIYIWYMM